MAWDSFRSARWTSRAANQD